MCDLSQKKVSDRTGVYMWGRLAYLQSLCATRHRSKDIVRVHRAEHQQRTFPFLGAETKQKLQNQRRVKNNVYFNRQLYI